MKEQPTGTIDIPIQERYMISLKEASSYFYIGIKKMRRMAEDNEGVFALFLGNRYIIYRPKFEEYLLKVMANSRTEQDAYKDFEDRLSNVEEKLPEIDIVRKATLNKNGKFTKRDIRELYPALSVSSIEGSLRKLVKSGELKK